jgi:hypothetical protein
MPKMTGWRVSDVLRGGVDVAGLTRDGYAPPSCERPAGSTPRVRDTTPGPGAG